MEVEGAAAAPRFGACPQPGDGCSKQKHAASIPSLKIRLIRSRAIV
jgi:hypothetical protein